MLICFGYGIIIHFITNSLIFEDLLHLIICTNDGFFAFVRGININHLSSEYNIATLAAILALAGGCRLYIFNLIPSFIPLTLQHQNKYNINYDEIIFSSLESNIFLFFKFKYIKKHFTTANVVVGISTLFLVFLIKFSGGILYILGYLFGYFGLDLVYLEYFFSGIIALLWRLGIRGIVEEIFKQPLYMTMDNSNATDGGSLQEDTSSNNLQEGTSSGNLQEGTSSGKSTDTQEGNLSSDTQTGKSTDTQTGKSTDTTKGEGSQEGSSNTTYNYAARRMQPIYKKQLDILNASLEKLTLQIENETDEDIRKEQQEQLNELIETSALLSKSMGEDISKYTKSTSENNINKRSSDFVDKDVSKKRDRS